MSTGVIHSIETMGLVDGPGIRTVVFMQGCRLRCAYCHNPDTWDIRGKNAQRLEALELVERLERYRPYYGDKGGVTFSGGEPLAQPVFLREALRLCRERGINTCLDTAGCGQGDYGEILANTDLILLDVKHYNKDEYFRLTGHGMEEFESFLAQAQKMGKRLWIRHVVVPGLTDSSEHLEGLERYLMDIGGIERIELLPYHTLGAHKYRELGIPYKLEGVEPMDGEKIKNWELRLNEKCCKI